MGQIRDTPPVLLILAAFSQHREALQWARQVAERHWGPVALASEQFDFRETDYYARSMGPNLLKTFFAFQRLIDPGQLASTKRLTNQWEQTYRQRFPAHESRPLNLDPGYLTPAKLVLASTKDHAHRVYLANGIFAEITLYYQHHQWRWRDWTYPDYRRPDYHAFFTRCRQYLREHDRAGPNR